MDRIGSVGGSRGDRIEVDAGGENTAVLVIGVVSADLCASGSGVKADLRACALRESYGKALNYLDESFGIVLSLGGVTAVDPDHTVIKGAALKFVKKGIDIFHNLKQAS